MTRISAPTILASVFVIVLILGTVSRAQAAEGGGCSNASLRGSFGFTSTGTLLALPPPLAGPFAEVGRQSFDGNGNTEGTATVSANGNIFGVTVSGTYVVNPACTGSMTLNVSFPDGSQATVHADFVIDDGSEVRSIGTDQGVVESRVYKKQLRGGQ